ncbi:glycosyltransferase family 39 protein [Haloarcula sp. S1CR25-12]|uniref:Glycosyltransferase family 39 protein n=1 Tax=Haloarcula saliterrae TaxID=2950534 RepID=A0ABU2FDI1_9EURY|nr:glycosyltransferase family 39 protein [Haloarcula sp. S1CR25-12]MDS0259776.1 glycosyltransferase family 39 protein [Haloarcula sp. S1CR25-12]
MFPYALLIFVGFAIYLYIIAVIQPTLSYWDASWYANSARHMINGGYWVIPHLHYDDAVFQPFVEKPPLGMWIQAVSMSIFGVSTFAARLPSVLAGVGIALLTFDLGRRWFNWETGITAGLLFYVQPLIFRRGHSMWTADIEMLFLFFGVAFVYAVLRAVEDAPRWFYVAGIAAGSAVLTKGVAAGVFLVILVPVAVRYRQTLTTREAVLGAVASFVIGGS